MFKCTLKFFLKSSKESKQRLFLKVNKPDCVIITEDERSSELNEISKWINWIHFGSLLIECLSGVIKNKHKVIFGIVN